MAPRTLPADPREALRLMREFAQHQWDCIFAADLSGVNGDEWAGKRARSCNCGFDKALALYDATLAARQDEPSPALRSEDEWDERTTREYNAAVANGRLALARQIERVANAKARDRALAANPPQTREGEGAVLPTETRLADCEANLRQMTAEANRLIAERAARQDEPVCQCPTCRESRDELAAIAKREAAGYPARQDEPSPAPVSSDLLRWGFLDPETGVFRGVPEDAMQKRWSRQDEPSPALRSLAREGAALLHLMKSGVFQRHEGAFEDCPAERCVTNRAALAANAPQTREGGRIDALKRALNGVCGVLSDADLADPVAMSKAYRIARDAIHADLGFPPQTREAEGCGHEPLCDPEYLALDASFAADEAQGDQ